MTTISEPFVNMPIIGAPVPVPNAAQRILVCGQKLAAGSATSGALSRNVSDDDLVALFGEGSMIEDAITGMREINDVTPVDVIAFTDLLAGVAAVGNVAVDGTSATAAGTLEVVFGSERNGKAEVVIPSGTTAANAAAAFETAFADLSKCVGTVEVDGSVTTKVNFTYNHKGTEGNSIPIKITGTVPGLTFTITAMTGGTGNPVLTSMFGVCGTQRYQRVVFPGSWDSSELVTFLDDRFNTANKILDGVGIMTISEDDEGDIETIISALNSQSLVVFCEKNEVLPEYKGPTELENPLAISAMFAGLSCLRLTEGADISDYVTAQNGPLDAVGGAALCTLPYFNSPLPIPVALPGTGWSETEIEAIKAAGGSVIGTNTAGNATIVGEVVTTYKTDTAGNADPTFHYLNTVDASSVGREYMFNQIKKDCAQSRLTDGDLIPGRNMNNITSITAKFIKYYGDLAGSDYCVLQAGETARAYFLRYLGITLAMSTGTVTVTMRCPIVTQLRTVVATWQIVFSAS